MRVLPLSVLLIAAGLAAPAAEAGEPTEYQIKGGYLYNFTNFVEWPPSAFPGPGAPFTIAILDRDHIASVVSAEMTGKHTGAGRPIRIVRCSRYADIPDDCQLLFVSRTVPLDWRELRARVDGRAVLVVGESDGFAQHGGAINFVVSGDSVRIEINQRRAAGAGLRLSGSLASIARLVRDKPSGEQ